MENRYLDVRQPRVPRSFWETIRSDFPSQRKRDHDFTIAKTQTHENQEPGAVRTAVCRPIALTKRRKLHRRIPDAANEHTITAYQTRDTRRA